MGHKETTCWLKKNDGTVAAVRLKLESNWEALED